MEEKQKNGYLNTFAFTLNAINGNKYTLEKIYFLEDKSVSVCGQYAFMYTKRDTLVSAFCL